MSVTDEGHCIHMCSLKKRINASLNTYSRFGTSYGSWVMNSQDLETKISLLRTIDTNAFS